MPWCGEKIAQAIAPARDRGLGDAEEDFGRLCGKAGGAHRRQGRDGLHQRLAGAAGFRYRDEARRGERQPCQQRRIGVGIEIVHEVQARAVAQSAEPRHPATGELRHRLAAEARSAGAEKDDVCGTGGEPFRGAQDAGEIVGLLREPQQRQLAVRVARPDPGQRIRAVRQGIGIGCRRHAVAADVLLAGIIDGLQDGHARPPRRGPVNRLSPAKAVAGRPR